VRGVSGRNSDSSGAIALRHYTPEARSILGALRSSAPRAKVIAGGAAFGVAPEALFTELGVDYAVAGDGERASVELVRRVIDGYSVEGVPGVVRQEDERVVFSPPGEEADLDSLPRPSLHRWIDLARYQRHGATIPIQTKRGCVYKCIYCTYRNVEGWGYRTRDPELVADEIAELRQEAGVTHFEFVDSTFNSPPGHALEVCEAITRRALNVKLETTNFTPAAVSDELLAAMRKAGFHSLGITAESASDSVLEKMEKGFDAAKVAEVAQRVERAGIRTLWIFLVGGPGETPETLEETLAFAAKRLAGGILLDTGEKSQAVGERTPEVEIRILKTMCRWATTVRVRGGQRLLAVNPLAGVKGRKRETEPHRPVATWERFQAVRIAMQELAEQTGNQRWVRMEFALVLAEATGRRIGSIRQLAWTDFDFDASTIRWRAASDKKRKAWLVPMPPTFMEEVKRFRLNLGGAFGGLVFPAPTDPTKALGREIFQHALANAATHAKLPTGGAWHSFRRKWASERKHHPQADVLAAGGWSPKSAAILTECYQFADDDAMLAVMSRRVSSPRSRPAEKCSPSPAMTTALMSSGNSPKKVSMPSTMASSRAVRFSGRARGRSASAPCRSARSEKGRSGNDSETGPGIANSWRTSRQP